MEIGHQEPYQDDKIHHLSSILELESKVTMGLGIHQEGHGDAKFQIS